MLRFHARSPDRAHDGRCLEGMLVAMRTVALAGVVVVLALGCGTKQAASVAVTREQCVAVRDHVVDLILEHYKANGPETFDGLDRSDVATMVGIPVGMTRETFGPFLASEAANQWLGNARARLVAGPGLSETVESCAQRGTPTHITCWREASTMEIFQRCPTP